MTDVFRADIRRPESSTTLFKRSTASLESEQNRRLCTAVVDGNLDELRTLLTEDKLDANARDKNGDTAGHQVGTVIGVRVVIEH